MTKKRMSRKEQNNNSERRRRKQRRYQVKNEDEPPSIIEEEKDEEYYYKLIEDKNALCVFLEKTNPTVEHWNTIQEKVDSILVKQLAHLILNQLTDLVRIGHPTAIDLVASWLHIPFFTEYYVINCLPFGFTSQPNALLENETLFGVLLSRPYVTKVRTCFAQFLNSPHPKVRSSVLSFIATCINNSHHRVASNYEDYVIENKIMFGTRVNSEISPVLILNLTVMLTEMIHSLVQNNVNGPNKFSLHSAILMPNMLAKRSEVMWNATSAEYAAMKEKEVNDFPTFPSEYRDNATRGLLLLYTISAFYYGYIPELKILTLAKTQAQWPAHDLAERERYLLDPEHLLSMIKVWRFISALFAHDIEHQPSRTKVYFDYFISAMKGFFTLVEDPITDAQKRNTITLFAKVFLNARDCIASWRTRASLISWIHSGILSTSSYCQITRSLLLSGELNGSFVEFATELAKYSFHYLDPSIRSIHLRSVINFINTGDKELSDLPVSVISRWCEELTSYVGAALEGMKTITRVEKKLEEVSKAKLNSIKTRVRIFIADMCNFLRILNTQENVKFRYIARFLHTILDAIAGPHCDLYAIDCRKAIGFDATFIISVSSSIILKFASDIRVYSIFAENERKDFNLLEAVARVLRLWCSAPLGVVQAMTALQTKVDRLKGLLKENEIPPGFEDPLHYTIMTEPVLLPSSNTIVDKETIVRFFQEGNNIDPYTRTPLSIDEVIPQDTLKSQIDQFWTDLEEKINQD